MLVFVSVYLSLYLLLSPLFHSLKAIAFIVFVLELDAAAPIEIILLNSGVILVINPKSLTKLIKLRNFNNFL